jgi:H+/Cl- antiporter ClcA
MEMTDNQGLLLPLMATAFVAYVTSRLVCPKPIYRVLALGFLPVVAGEAEAGDSVQKADA